MRSVSNRPAGRRTPAILLCATLALAGAAIGRAIAFQRAGEIDDAAAARNATPQDVQALRALQKISVFNPEVRYPKNALPLEVLPQELLQQQKPSNYHNCPGPEPALHSSHRYFSNQGRPAGRLPAMRQVIPHESAT